jgi:hypothetical protein
MRLQCFSSSDYAGFESGKWDAYYGCEETDPDTGDWCFVLKKDGREVFRASNEQLLAICPEESPLGMLTAGLALYMTRK